MNTAIEHTGRLLRPDPDASAPSSAPRRRLRLTGLGCAGLLLALVSVCLPARSQSGPPNASLAAEAKALATSSPARAAKSAAKERASASGSTSGSVAAGADHTPGSEPRSLRDDPATDVFGSQIFRGQFAARSFTGFNPDYQITPGDRITVRLWGAFALEDAQVVDAQGNIFIPNIGPVRVQGVRNGSLNDTVQERVKRVFRANVQSYASLDVAQPVKIYVTGFVRQPGLYNGLSSDSVLHYLDQAGGIDPERGSYLAVDVLRAGKLRARIDLYRFLLAGEIEPMQLHDGDTVLVAARQFSVRVGGDVANANVFELKKASTTADQILAIARPKASATHLSVLRQAGGERRSEYHPIAQAATVLINNGDEVTVTSDKVPGTLLIRLDGAHRGPRTAVLPYGARLKDALALIVPAPQARIEALQLYRRSVAVRQKEMLNLSLEKLETQALTARSSTNEEATLRTREADLVLQFTERARRIETKGQLVFSQLSSAGETLLEDGDTLFVPEESSQVTLHGEVMFPLALHHEAELKVADYIRLAGGYTQNADTSRVLLIRRNGSVSEVRGDAQPAAGEELMVLPKADSKNIEIARGITQIVYQIAIAAKVALGL